METKFGHFEINTFHLSQLCRAIGTNKTKKANIDFHGEEKTKAKAIDIDRGGRNIGARARRRRSK